MEDTLCICFILRKGVMQLSFAVSMHKITCSISIPNSMRSRLSWNELTQLLHHRRKHRKSHHTHLWHKLTLCLSCALHKLKLCLKVASTSIEWFNKLPRVSIRQPRDTWKEAVPKLLRVLNMRLQSCGEFLYNLRNERLMNHGCLILNALIFL